MQAIIMPNAVYFGGLLEKMWSKLMWVFSVGQKQKSPLQANKDGFCGY
jgi:hypothetical protein